MSKMARERRRTHQTALCGVLAALAVGIMMLGGLVPFATFCCPLLASLVLLPAMDECGSAMAVGLYAVIGILSLLIAPDKEAAFLFVFIGYYPVLRPKLSRIRLRPVRAACKLLVFNAAVLAMYNLLLSVFRVGELTAEFEAYSRWMLAGLLALGNLTFLLFDLLLSRLTALYQRRLKPQLRKLFRV